MDARRNIRNDAHVILCHLSVDIVSKTTVTSLDTLTETRRNNDSQDSAVVARVVPVNQTRRRLRGVEAGYRKVSCDRCHVIDEPRRCGVNDKWPRSRPELSSPPLRPPAGDSRHHYPRRPLSCNQAFWSCWFFLVSTRTGLLACLCMMSFANELSLSRPP